MKKDFDFDDIGKQTPYSVPDGFFDSMQRNVLKSVKGDSHKHSFRLKMIVAGVLATAAMLCGVIFFISRQGGNVPPDGQKLASAAVVRVVKDTADTDDSSAVPKAKRHSVPIKVTGQSDAAVDGNADSNSDDWIDQMSDEDLEALTTLAENDAFLN